MPMTFPVFQYGDQTCCRFLSPVGCKIFWNVNNFVYCDAKWQGNVTLIFVLYCDAVFSRVPKLKLDFNLGLCGDVFPSTSIIMWRHAVVNMCQHN